MRLLTRRSSMCNFAVAWALLLISLLPGIGAQAAPVVAVDADADTPGVEAVRSVAVAEQFDVLVRVSGVSAPDGLNAFQLGLSYDPAVLTATSIQSGGFLAAPTRIVAQDVAGSPARFAETSVGNGTAEDEGVLVRVTFAAVQVGTSALSVGGMRLASDLGEVVQPAAASGASVMVVPEPAATLLGACAIAVIVGLTRRRPRRRGRDAGAFLILALVCLGAPARAADPDPALDANQDGWIDVLDVSLVSSCQGVDPSADAACAAADVDADDDVDSVDLDLVIAAFGGVVGPPFRLAGELFDCSRDGFPCGMGAATDTTADRMDAVLAQLQVQLDAGASLDQTEALVLAEPDVVECFRGPHTLACRLQDAPPFVIHDGTAARLEEASTATAASTGSSAAAIGGGGQCCTGPFDSGTRVPVGQRVVGRDRDEDGRRDRDKAALILAPFSAQFGVLDSAQFVHPWLEATVPGLVFDDYEGSVIHWTDHQVTLDEFLSFSDYDVVFVSTHGNVLVEDRNGSPQPLQYLELMRDSATGPPQVRSSCKALKARVSSLAAGAGEGLICGLVNAGTTAAPMWQMSVKAGPKFFEAVYPDGLTNAIIYLDACRSFNMTGLRDALVGRHSVFFGWDDYVFAGLSANAAEGIFARAAGKGLRLSRAWQRMCQEDGYCVFPTTRAGNDKPEALHFDYDGVDQRVREVITILDPHSLDPAEDGSVLVERVTGFVDDGNIVFPNDQLFFMVDFEGFEPEDLVLETDPSLFFERTFFFGGDHEGVPQPTLYPLSDSILEPVGHPDDFRWRTISPMTLLPLALGLADDLSKGGELDIDLKLQLTPSEDKGPSEPRELGDSYARNFTHTIDTCTFTATVSGDDNGVFSGITASVSRDGDFDLDVLAPISLTAPVFSANLRAVLLGALPGEVTGFGLTVPNGFSQTTYSWDPGMVSTLGIGTPTITLSFNDDERFVGSVSGMAVNGSGAEEKRVSFSIDFDADVVTAEIFTGDCVR